VTGGYDMSMSEIQEAAEIITSAVSPDANIIFGATLKPEIEDELIITVIATGFDSAYFQESENEETETSEPSRATEEAVDSVDMNLDHSEAAAIFNDETETSSDMWNSSVEQEDESDTPAFLRRRKKHSKKSKTEE